VGAKSVPRCLCCRLVEASMLCIQVGSHDNPCRIKIIGPTLGFIVGVVAAVICWPLGVIIYCCNRPMADNLFSRPVALWNSVAAAIPI